MIGAKALYIHFPWCVSKCPYCDFNSHIKPDELDEKSYINCLLEDLKHEISRTPLNRISSIFLGGGTPSLFSGDAIGNLVQNIRSLLELDEACEITIEANPESADNDNFTAYHKAGINRISIGAQSFRKNQLKNLSRAHKVEDIYAAVKIAKDSGIRNINLDVMFGLPGQSLEQALFDLKSAIDLRPQHISWYQFTIEPNTFFAHHPPDNIPDADNISAIQNRGTSLLESQGFKRYEVSAFAKAGFQCQHNLNYWHFGDYIGIGAGAHGKLSDASQKKVLRYTKNKKPAMYLANCANNQLSLTTLGTNDLVLEFMLNALRLKSGFKLKLFEQTTLANRENIMNKIQKAEDLELIELDGELVKPTPLGFDFLNDLINIFYEN